MKKVLAGLTTAALSLSLLAACGTKDKEAKDTASQTTEGKKQVETTKPAESGDKPVELTWWAFPVFKTVDGETGKYEKSLAEAFMKKNPNVKIKVEMIDFSSGPEKITTAIQGNTAPDILFDAPGRLISYAKAGHLAKLNDLFTDEFKKDVDNENLLGACSDGKDYYMYPLSSAPFVMAVDKKALEEAGVWDKVPQKGERLWDLKTFDEVNKALAAKGKKNAIVFAKNQGGDQGTRAFFSNLFGGAITNKDLTKYTTDSPEMVEAFEYVQKQVKEKNLTNGVSYNGGDAIEQFVNGSVSQVLLWSPGLGKNNEEKCKKAGIESFPVTFPVKEGLKPQLEYLVNGFGVFNNKDEAKVKAAKEFVKFLCDDQKVGKENVVSTNAFPVRKSFGELYPNNEEMAFYASLSKYYSNYYNTIDGFAQMRPYWYTALQELQTDGDAKAIAKKFTEQANATIKK